MIFQHEVLLNMLNPDGAPLTAKDRCFKHLLQDSALNGELL